MSDANKAKKLLETHDAYFRSKHWFADTYVKTDGFHFSIRHQLNGCSIVDCYQALQFLYEALCEEDDTPEKPRLTDEEVLLQNGYEILGKSPLEITSISEEHVFVSGEAAVILLSSLRSITK